jgi:phage tail-like protein
MAGVAADAQMGLSNRFAVDVMPGDRSLGSWAKVEGLDVTWEVPDYRAGDQGNFRWLFPGKNSYSNVKLSRTVVNGDTQSVKEWLEENSMNFKPSEITITLKDAAGVAVMDWTCKNAVVLKWSVQGFDAGASKVAIETLEFSHRGFLDDETTG